MTDYYTTLIELVRKEPELWNPNVKNYQNKNIQSSLWLRISDVLKRDCKFY